MTYMSNDTFHLVCPTKNHTSQDAAAARQRLQTRALPKALHDLKESAKFFQLEPPLQTAINMALAVGAPLLLTGEPGTGKTQVAWYLGWYFDIPVFSYQVRSTATADDMKYDFDAVAYLRNAQDPDAATRQRQDFLRKKALWLAYECETPSVLLIDEIDKAPRDFPNDLLLELANHRFQHPFLDEMITPKSSAPPIVVITSNVERRLPDAFLRRCIFHHIELTEALVQKAVEARTGDFPHIDETTRAEALKRFWEIRANDQIQKPPSTAEVLVWLAILSALRVTAGQLKSASLPDLPGLTALLKDKDDIERVRQ
jgi:MoxR-like ATPase